VAAPSRLEPSGFPARRVWISVLALGLTVSVSRHAAATKFLFSTFKGDDAAGMKLSIYSSSDALNFTLLSDTGFGGNTTYLRDPSIMKYSDGKYYVAYTDPTTASCCNPEDHFGIAVSSDLIHWTNLTTVKAGVPNVSHVWAPEWFIEGGVVRIIANIDTGHSDFQPYAFTAQDSALTSWTGPTVLGIGTDYIDTFVAKLGSTYHAFIKSELTRFLEHATAPSLTGPWTFVGKGDWAGWGNGLEGPAIVKLDDGRYQMYVDPQQAGPYEYMTSSDLNTWSAKSSLPGPAANVLRHGTIIRDELAPGLTGAGGASGAAGAGGSLAGGGASGHGGAASLGGSSGDGGVFGVGGASDGGLGGSSAVGGSSSSGGAPGSAGSAVGNAGSAGSAVVDAGSAGSHDSGGALGVTPSTSPASESSSGCSCSMVSAASARTERRSVLLVGFALLGFVARRRDRQARHAVRRPRA
jgi:hypothetical protein